MGCCTMAFTPNEWTDTIWNVLMNEFKNEIGVSALMGNFWAESAFCPYRCQSRDFEQSWNYTVRVRNGNVSEYDFVHNGPGGGGYSLAQWTYSARKQNYYTFVGQQKIGDTIMSTKFAISELNGDYSGTGNAVRNAVDIRTASDYILHNYERPADQSTQVEIYRANLATQVYNYYTGKPVPPDPPNPPDPPDPPVPPDPYPPYLKKRGGFMFRVKRRR